MSYVNLGSVSWGSAPTIGVVFAYDYQRNGTNMLYRVRVTVSPVSGSSYFGYPIYVNLSLDGSAVISGETVKAAGPSTWTGNIVYESGWMSLYKTSGTTALSIRLYSGSGSTRDTTYSYTLPVSSYYSGGGGSSSSAISMADFSLSFGNLTIGQAAALTFTRPSGSYTAQVGYSFGAASGTATLTAAATATTRVVYSWTVPDALANQIAGTTSGTGTLTLSVYRNGTYFGQKSYTFTAYVGETLRPTATLTTTVRNDNATLSAWGLCVKGLSRVDYLISAQGQGGATISQYNFRFAGQELTGASGTTEVFSAVGALTPAATVTDSRGRTATVTAEPITVYDYNLPSLRSCFAWRCDAQGTEREDGAYLRVQCSAEHSTLGGRNSVTLRVRYRAVGGTYGGYTTLPSGTVTTIGGNLDAETSYEVELSAIDTIGGEKAVTYTSSTRQVTLHLKEGGTGAAFGKYATSDTLECAWDAAFDGDVAVAGDLTVTGNVNCQGVTFGNTTLVDMVYPVGAIYLSASSAHPATLFGGTWSAIEDSFLLCAGSGYSAGTTGGSSSHVLTAAEMPTHTHTFSGETGSEDLSHSHSVGADRDGALGSGTYTVHSGGYPGNTTNPSTSTVDLDHSHSFSGTTGAAGSGTAFSLLPPYLAVYAWKRIA